MHDEVNFSVTSHLIASAICPISDVCVTSFCPLSFLAQVNTHLSLISARHHVLSTKPVRYGVTWTQMLLAFTVNRNNVKVSIVRDILYGVLVLYMHL